MQLLSTIALLATATGLTWAAPVSDSGPGSPALLSKRDQLLCQLHNYPQLTEPRVANIVDDLRHDRVLTVPPNACTRIACYGGTGAFLCSGSQTVYGSKTLGDQIDSKYGECYGHTPQSWENDMTFNPAYQYFTDGYNILVHGSEPC